MRTLLFLYPALLLTTIYFLARKKVQIPIWLRHLLFLVGICILLYFSVFPPFAGDRLVLIGLLVLTAGSYWRLLRRGPHSGRP